MVICPVFFGVGQVNAKTDTNNFYFDSFEADYYLSKDSDGISHLRVVENLTAVFPSFDQNKGIQRMIPFTNQNGLNITLPSLNESNITILRNGEPEPIWNIERNGDYYLVETGTDDYVRGVQTYTLEYEFEKVVTDFGDYQELYWDTNGNGWSQWFGRVNARLHFDDDIFKFYTGGSWCYTGAYGDRESECTIRETYDGVEFSVSNLEPYENLTFDVELEPGSFVVPGPVYSYAAIIAMIVILSICIIFLIISVIKYQKTSKKIKEYKGIFVAPQYQPHPKYDLAEMTEIYLGKKKDVKVGLLLDMIVKKQIELYKGDGEEQKKKKDGRWSILVKDTGVRQEKRIVLELLKGGESIQNGDVINLKRRTATHKLMALGEDFDKGVLEDLKQDGLVEKNYTIGSAKTLSPISSFFSSLFWAIIIVGFAFAVFGDFIDEIMSGAGKVLLWKDEAMLVIVMMVTLTLAIKLWMGKRGDCINLLTTEGLKASKYMEGLKLYIKMAEADRMKLLQSMKGVDVSPSGIVKLYEKLLPYAAIFGLEKSWMDEMKEYCNAEEIDEPNYLSMGITTSQLSRALANSAMYASSAGHTIAGGGSYSSSSSGSSGSGFSGGGGGGGGGGGR